AADDSPDTEALPVRLDGPALLDIAPAADALAGLRIVEHSVFAIDLMLGLEIVGVGCRPMPVERGSYGFRAPGDPLVTAGESHSPVQTRQNDAGRRPLVREPA